MLPGLFQHLLLTLRLNMRSRQALIYGYLVPVFFLFAFAAIFRWDSKPLAGRMGQLLTISILGGACFGMPTAMVGERERGVWRRYRLLPGGTRGLAASTLLARFIIIASAALLQILLAWLFYKTPWPARPLQLLGVYCVVAFAFEGMGLVIAAVADNVPAVQALGQAIFLPMIMIGGVGVPLTALPVWAQRVAGFLPGRYAVDSLQPCFDGQPSSIATPFALTAMLVIGTAGMLAGAFLFRWDSNQQRDRRAWVWVSTALLSWLGVGTVALLTGRLTPVAVAATQPVVHHHRTAATNPMPWDLITQEQIDSLQFTGLPRDDGETTPVAPSATVLPVPDDQVRMDQFRQQLDAWPPGHVDNDGQRVRNLLAAASIADILIDSEEGPIARAVFDRLKADFDQDELIHILAWIAINPDAGDVINRAPELELPNPANPDIVRDRTRLYALKLLGRLLGKLPDIQPPD